MATPNSAMKQFKIRRRWMFSKMHGTKNSISNLAAPKNHKAQHVSIWKWVELNGLMDTSLQRNVNHSHSCVWNIMQVHSRLNPMMQTTIGLSRFSSSLPLRMQCTHRQSRWLYLGCTVGLKVGERGGQIFWICGANS